MPRGDLQPVGLGTLTPAAQGGGSVMLEAQSWAVSRGQFCPGVRGRSPQCRGSGNGTVTTDSTSTRQGALCGRVLPSADDPTQTGELGHAARKSPERCSGP